MCRPILLATLMLAATAAGCASKPSPALPPPPAAAGDPFGERFAAGRALLSGFDHDPTADWNPGDTVLLGIAVDGAGPPREWYMRVVAGPRWLEMNGMHYTSPGEAAIRTGREKSAPKVVAKFNYIMTVVDFFDAKGQKASSTIAMMPELCLRYGLIEYVEEVLAGRGLQSPDDPEEALPGGDLKATLRQRRFMAGWIALSRLPDFLGREKSIGGVIQNVVEHPGLVSIVLNGGVSLQLNLKANEALREDPSSDHPGSVYRVPLDVEINDTLAMSCVLRLTRASPPLGPCNGLLQIEGVNPSDPTKRLTVRLLAAKRGKDDPPAAPESGR